MKPVVGIFKSRFDAFRAVDGIKTLGVSSEKINILTPNSTDREVAAVKVSDTEQPGMGAAVGSVVGGRSAPLGGLALGLRSLACWCLEWDRSWRVGCWG